MYVVKCGVPDAPVEKFRREDEAMEFACLMIERDEQTGIEDGAEWSVEEEPEIVPNYKHRFTVEEGLTYDLLMPLSECAMHMRIAGKVQRVRAGRCGVYLVNEDGSGGPHMTDGEAGVLSQGARRYAYGWKVRA
jgi:hypothetical protein